MDAPLLFPKEHGRGQQKMLLGGSRVERNSEKGEEGPWGRKY